MRFKAGMATTILTAAAVLVIDAQAGLFQTARPPRDTAGVIDRINRVTILARTAGAPVVFVQHDGDASEPTVLPGTAGWRLDSRLVVNANDLVLRKTTCDAFYHTPLEEELRKRGVTTVVVTGYATEFCVDSTIRAAVSRDFQVVVAADAHTTGDQPELTAAQIITHHNWVWANLIATAGLEVVATADIAFARRPV
jgi:nicotinamidase-related amidase